VLRLVSYAYMPSPLPRQVRWSLSAHPSPSSAAFPVIKPGRLLQLLFRGLLSVHSRYGLHARGVAMRPFTPRAPTALLPPLPPRLLPGGANQFPGGSCTRCSPAPFTAHFIIELIASSRSPIIAWPPAAASCRPNDLGDGGSDSRPLSQGRRLPPQLSPWLPSTAYPAPNFERAIFAAW
jgi:hypothetical protein